MQLEKIFTEFLMQNSRFSEVFNNALKVGLEECFADSFKTPASKPAPAPTPKPAPEPVKVKQEVVTNVNSQVKPEAINPADEIKKLQQTINELTQQLNTAKLEIETKNKEVVGMNERINGLTNMINNAEVEPLQELSLEEIIARGEF